MKQADISIVILNHNTKELTMRAIASSLAIHDVGVQVIVVDNASSDGSLEEFRALAHKESRLTVIASATNSGFSAGNNLALQIVKTPYAMLLNSDAYFPEDFLMSPLLEVFSSQENVGIITPRVELPDGSLDPACHRGIPTPWNSLTYFLGLEQFGGIFGGYHLIGKDMRRVHDISACSGAALLISHTVMQEIGLLDEQFFMYGEDLDWCYRATQAGYRVLFFPHARVIHEKYSSGLKKKKKKTSHAFFESMELFYKKHDVGPPWLESAVLLGIKVLARVKEKV